MARTDNITPELLKYMKEAGCFQIWYGIQSVDESTLKRIKRNSDLDQISATLRNTKDAGIKNVVDCILGFPWEIKEDYISSRNFVEEYSDLVTSFQNHILTPLPNTEIYDTYKNNYGFENWWERGSGPVVKTEIGSDLRCIFFNMPRPSSSVGTPRGEYHISPGTDGASPCCTDRCMT